MNNTSTNHKFILFAGHTGHKFFPFEAESFEAATEIAYSKGWAVEDWALGVDDVGIISVLPHSMVKVPNNVVKFPSR